MDKLNSTFSEVGNHDKQHWRITPWWLGRLAFHTKEGCSDNPRERLNRYGITGLILFLSEDIYEGYHDVIFEFYSSEQIREKLGSDGVLDTEYGRLLGANHEPAMTHCLHNFTLAVSMGHGAAYRRFAYGQPDPSLAFNFLDRELAALRPEAQSLLRTLAIGIMPSCPQIDTISPEACTALVRNNIKGQYWLPVISQWQGYAATKARHTIDLVYHAIFPDPDIPHRFNSHYDFSPYQNLILYSYIFREEQSALRSSVTQSPMIPWQYRTALQNSIEFAFKTLPIGGGHNFKGIPALLLARYGTSTLEALYYTRRLMMDYYPELRRLSDDLALFLLYAPGQGLDTLNGDELGEIRPMLSSKIAGGCDPVNYGLSCAGLVVLSRLPAAAPCPARFKVARCPDHKHMCKDNVLLREIDSCREHFPKVYDEVIGPAVYPARVRARSHALTVQRAQQTKRMKSRSIRRARASLKTQARLRILPFPHL